MTFFLVRKSFGLLFAFWVFMKWICLLSLFISCSASAQEYRIIYDPNTIPELYYSTSISLQQKAGNEWREVSENYRLRTNFGKLRGRELSYSEKDLLAENGRILVDVTVAGKSISLPLKLPVLTGIRYHLYTDSIKPILNYYVNVEGVFLGGSIFPLGADAVELTADIGKIEGMEWIAPDKTFDKVTFTAKSRLHPAFRETITLYRQRFTDPRDAMDYEDEQLPTVPSRRR